MDSRIKLRRSHVENISKMVVASNPQGTDYQPPDHFPVHFRCVPVPLVPCEKHQWDAALDLEGKQLTIQTCQICGHTEFS